MPRNTFVAYFKKGIDKILCFLRIGFLYFKCLLTLKKIQVDFIIFFDHLGMPDNNIEFCWKVTGCYKTKIKDIGVLPGNDNSVVFKPKSHSNQILISFYGIHGRIDKQIEIKTGREISTKKLLPKTIIPKLKSTSFRQYPIESPLCSKVFSSEISEMVFRLNIPNTTKMDLSVHFESFDKDKYLTKLKM
jgi:hypothetical protein